MKNKYKAIIFDFDGVLCYDRFYTTLPSKYSEVSKYIQEVVFGSHGMVNNWMRGRYTWRDINRIVANNTDIDYEELNKLFVKSVEAMKLDPQIMEYVQSLKDRGYKLGLVTNNMDVFSEIHISNHNLDKFFDVIECSFDRKMLKHDNNSELFKIALKKLGANAKDTLLVDDSEKACKAFADINGNTFLYNKKLLSKLKGFL